MFGAANLYDPTVLVRAGEFRVDVGWLIWNDKIDVYNPVTNVLYHVNLDLFEFSIAGIPYMIDPTMMTIKVISADGSQQSSSDVPRSVVAAAALQLSGQHPTGTGYGDNPTFSNVSPYGYPYNFTQAELEAMAAEIGGESNSIGEPYIGVGDVTETFRIGGGYGDSGW
jgi:hypothetical protein